ncbi:MAG TPA: hypothetical protein VGI66_07395 [Streptosporangiaceae bacterium]|jgi:hypothetical protein
MARWRSRLNKFRTPLVLLAIGIFLILIAWVIYPSPETGIPVPSYPTVTIYTNAAIYQVQYSVIQLSPATAVLQIMVEQQTGIGSGTSGSPVTPTVQVALPLGFTFQDCHPYLCHNDPTTYGSSWYEPLHFKPAWATVDFQVNSGSFGVNFNDVNAYAAIPEIDYEYRSGLTTPTLFAQYQIASAASYDWSAFPAASVTSTTAQWHEPILESDTAGTYGITAGRIASGVDHSRESLDQDLTFLAGALLGLGGGAILSGVQEVLRRD